MRDGHVDPELKDRDNGSYDTLFASAGREKYVPRAIFADLDPSTIDEIRTGTLRTLYHPDSLVSGKEDAASNYARGHYTVGRDLADTVMERIRRTAG